MSGWMAQRKPSRVWNLSRSESNRTVTDMPDQEFTLTAFWRTVGRRHACIGVETPVGRWVHNARRKSAV